jgi:hypothetical protein
MDRAYEGDETRQLALDLGYILVVPPKANRLNPWEYDRALYRKRNEVERLFRRLKEAQARAQASAQARVTHRQGSGLASSHPVFPHALHCAESCGFTCDHARPDPYTMGLGMLTFDRQGITQLIDRGWLMGDPADL